MNNLLLQIIWPDGTTFRFQPGGDAEIDLENKLAEKLISKGVGVFRTESHVENDFREAFKEVMYEFKNKVANP